ncbi:cytochrome P450 [Favolaschia claudopus]|uniref:Cytochrome P450 n=1 Tax=Favolaschia claudopus TaxID=2862362 RepID=A0AAW0CR15_9AGAR
MIIITQVVLPIAGVFLFYILFHLARIWYRNLTNGLGYVDGPTNGSFVFGNFKQMAEDVYLTSKWRQQFGRIFKFKGLFGITELHLCDVKAISHIVSRSDIYERSPVTRLSIQSLLGRGILSAEGDEHRKHRRALNPAFGVAQIRAMTEIFVEKGYQLREIWTRDLAKSTGAGTGKGQVIEVQAWLRRLTLDVIGQAGFNYDFDALQGEGKPNELNDAFTSVFHSPHANRYAAFRLAGGVMPILRLLPGPGWRIVLAARTTMLSIAARIVTRNKADLKSSGEGKRGLEGKRDLLSSLLKANLADSEAQRLSDTEVVGQIPAFFLAGHETTSSALSWALYALSEKPTVQNKLREELLTISTDNPTLDELNSLAYLDCVVRETMRLHSPVLFNTRYATQDDVLPLARPFIGKDGRERDSIPIKRGQTFHIPINAINTDPTIWGEDAGEFTPERWEHIPDAVSGVPGVWGNLLTFFAGNHNCIGFRFSLAEMKAILFVIIRAFEFEAALPTGSIGRAATGALQKPAVLGKENGSGLPLIVKVYSA